MRSARGRAPAGRAARAARASVAGAALALALVGTLASGGCADLTITRPVDAIRVAIAHPSFSRDIQPILTETCASSIACHAGSSPQAGLWLTPDVVGPGQGTMAYVGLVNATAAFAPDLKRVRPFQPDSSFLLLMLGENATLRRGVRRMPLTSLPVPAPVIETIRNWIVDGAPNN